METNAIRFDDGAAYERYMGTWSRLAGEVFLDWLKPAPRLRWLDVGCGSGAFTELLARRCAPASVHGIDPAEGQLAFARARGLSECARFYRGDAMALPFPDDSFDVAVMPLVLFFVPDPSRGIAEMVRVVAPGGTVAAYAWDLDGGGFPYGLLQDEMRALGVAVPAPPSPEAARLEALQEAWRGAGLEAVETREIAVERTYSNFDDYWATLLGGPSVAAGLKTLAPEDLSRLEARLRSLLAPDAAGRITYGARANAVKGRVPR